MFDHVVLIHKKTNLTKILKCAYYYIFIITHVLMFTLCVIFYLLEDNNYIIGHYMTINTNVHFKVSRLLGLEIN